MVQVGEKYNHLLVVRRLENHITKGGSAFSKWLCQCDCGNTVEVLGSSLTSGHTKSCGCLSKQYKVKTDEMLGKKFGKLTVVSRAPSHKIPSGGVYDMWNCICECGNTTVTFGRHLRNGKILSCGCTRALHQAEAGFSPKAEEWTKMYFDERGISYEYQKTFSGLVGKNGGLLSYDFYLPDISVLLELHGLQHYRPVDWFGGHDGFEKQQLHDSLKSEYARCHDYKLIVIPTDHISKKRLYDFLDEYHF